MPQDTHDFDAIPAPGPVHPEDVIEDLGDGLVLRRARPEDAPANAAFQAVVQADPPDFERLDHIGEWVTQLMDGSHPSMRAREFLLVHDTNQDRIASSLGLLAHELRYDGIAVPAGMPELVGTHPDYRHRRLISRQFEEVHRWSEERGDLLQIIDGIPWYYRQFGYEMAAQRFGGMRVPLHGLPDELPEGLRVRHAGVGDAAFLASVFDHGMQRYRLSCARSEDFWRFELEGRREGSTIERQLCIVETTEGAPVAFFNHVRILLDDRAFTPVFEVAPGVGWQEPLDAVLAHLGRVGAEMGERDEGPFVGASLMLGVEHPAYGLLGDRDVTPVRPYAWYLRVADPAAFLERVAPALEARLVGSPHEGHSGELRISSFRTGVSLRFEDGRIAEVGRWRPATDDLGDVAFPDQTFLHLLFGHRDLEALMGVFPDLRIYGRKALVETLFPPQPSFVMATT